MFKNLLKKYLLYYKIRDRFNPSIQIAQRQLYHFYREKHEQAKLPKLDDCGYRVFSQFEEDGKLLFIFSLLGMTHKTFIEIGADDGVNSNSANLYFNFDWQGLFIDGNSTSIKRGKRFYSRYPHPWYAAPKFIEAMVKRENINKLIKSAGIEGEIGFLSIDIDGNDYWIWDALDVVKPQVVMIETHVIYGMNDIVVPYDPNYVYPGKHKDYHGASPLAMQKLGKKKGYRLVGANELGFNFIFLRNDLLKEEFSEVSVESVLKHPATVKSFEKFEAVKDWEFIQPK